MTDMQLYRVEELNPFQEWHLHGSSIEIEQALNWAKSIRKQINRSVRVLDPAGNVIVLLR